MDLGLGKGSAKILTVAMFSLGRITCVRGIFEGPDQSESESEA